MERYSKFCKIYAACCSRCLAANYKLKKPIKALRNKKTNGKRRKISTKICRCTHVFDSEVLLVAITVTASEPAGVSLPILDVCAKIMLFFYQ